MSTASAVPPLGSLPTIELPKTPDLGSIKPSDIETLMAAIVAWLRRAMHDIENLFARAVATSAPASPQAAHAAPAPAGAVNGAAAGATAGPAPQPPAAAAPTTAPDQATADLSRRLVGLQPIGKHGDEDHYAGHRRELNQSLDELGIHNRVLRCAAHSVLSMEGYRRDPLKDNTVAANGYYNISESVLKLAGVGGSAMERAAMVQRLSPTECVKYMCQAIEKAGLHRFLCAQRGGAKGLEDERSHTIPLYENNFLYTLKQHLDKPSLMTSDKREWIETPYE